MAIQTSTRKSLLLAGRLVIAWLMIEAFGGIFAPDVPECENAESQCGERPPVAADDGHAVVVDGDDDEGAGDGAGVWAFE